MFFLPFSLSVSVSLCGEIICFLSLRAWPRRRCSAGSMEESRLSGMAATALCSGSSTLSSVVAAADHCCLSPPPLDGHGAARTHASLRCKRVGHTLRSSPSHAGTSRVELPSPHSHVGPRQPTSHRTHAVALALVPDVALALALALALTLTLALSSASALAWALALALSLA